MTPSRPRRFTESLRSAYGIALFTLLLIVGGGWTGDILKGDCLALGGVRICAGQTLDWTGLLVSLVLFALGAAGLAAASRAYLPIRHLRANTNPRGHRALILTLSQFPSGVTIADDGGTIVKGGQSVTLTGSLQTDIALLEPLRVNIQQVLRALAPHADTVSHLVLLCSPGAEGSAVARERIARLLSLYVKDATIDCGSKPVDFENLEDMRLLITTVCDILVKQHDCKPVDIMIDVTGGLKTASIAAALATLHQPDLQFQYVSTLTGSVLAFDVVSEAPTRMS